MRRRRFIDRKEVEIRVRRARGREHNAGAFLAALASCNDRPRAFTLRQVHHDVDTLRHRDADAGRRRQRNGAESCR